MNNLLEETSGIDCNIKEMQEDIYKGLNNHFSRVEGFGRIYRAERPEGLMPMTINSRAEYEHFYLNEDKEVQFGFLDGTTHSSSDGILFRTPLKIIFWFNLKNLGWGYRADAEAQRIASTILKNDITLDYDRTDIEIETGIDNVFNGFHVDHLKSTDTQPNHLFSLNTSLSYYLTKKC